MKQTESYLINKRLTSALGGIVLALCFATVNAQAQTYSLTDLGVLPGKKDSVPSAINTQGQVAGTSGVATATESAFRYNSNSKKPALEDLGKTPDGSISRAFAINSTGEVVGDSSFGASDSVRRAALFIKGSVAELGSLKEAGEYSRANGINASGQVVGFASAKLDDNASRAFFWSASTGMVDLGTLGGAYAQAMSINDSGFVTGNSQTAEGGVGEAHAFLYRPFAITENPTKPMRDLGTLGGNSSYGTFINANNHVVGYSTISATDTRIHAFLHDGTKMRDLGSLGGKTEASDQSFALGVNSADQVVGYTYLPAEGASTPSGPVYAPQQVAFIYRNGVMANLNDLIGGAAEAYTLHAATAINDNGQIVASAFDHNSGVFRAVLLTPMISRARP